MKNIVCFGDSNTHGYDAQTGGRFPRDIRWTGKLQQLLGPGYYVIEEGLSGRTTVFDDPLYEGLNGLTAVTPCLLSHEPVDLLIIMLGTNDVKARFSCSPANISRGLERLIQKALATKEAWREKGNILVICPPPIEPEYASTSIGNEMGPECDLKSSLLPPLYEVIAKQYGCHFLDAGQLNGIKMNAIDFMHLTSASHEILAGKLADLLPSLI